MSDDLDDLPPPAPPESKKRRSRRRARDEEEKKVVFKGDLEAAHRKFMAIMIGLGVVALLIMWAMSAHVEFPTDGGM